MQAPRFAAAVLSYLADYLENWATAIRRRVRQTLPEDVSQPADDGASWEQKSALQPPAHWLERVQRDAPQLLSEDGEGVITVQIDPEVTGSHAGSRMPKPGLRQTSAARPAQAIPIYQPRRFTRRERRFDKQGLPESARSQGTLREIADELRIAAPDQPTAGASASPLVIRPAQHRHSQAIDDAQARYNAAASTPSGDLFAARPARFPTPPHSPATASASLDAPASQNSHAHFDSAQALRQGSAGQEHTTAMSGQQPGTPDLRKTTPTRQQVKTPHSSQRMAQRPPLPAVGGARQPSQTEPRNGSLLISDKSRWPDLSPEPESADEPEQAWRQWQHRQRLNREQRGRW